MKKVVLIVAYRNFQDKEYSLTKDILENGGMEVSTASTEKGIAKGMVVQEANVDLLVEEIKSDDFEAIVFVGGIAALDYLDNEISYNLVKKTINQNKILAAICIAPVILAKAGALKNKKATVWRSSLKEGDENPIDILKKNNAEFIDKKVVVDGRIITANGPGAAEKFGESILKAIQ